MSDGDAVEQSTRTELLLRLRVGVLVVAGGALFVSGLTNLTRAWDSYDLPGVQLAAFAVLVAVLAREAYLLVRRRGWLLAHQLLAVAAVLAASVISYATLPTGHVATSGDWVYGVANWVGLAVLIGGRLRLQLAFLAVHGLLGVTHLLLTTEGTDSTWLRFATGSLGVLGYPLCIALPAAAFRRIATTVATNRRELERLRIDEAAAAETHLHRQTRFAHLTDSAMPLLEGLASGALDPQDAHVRRDCAIEAARMRRLFAEVDAVPHPLLHELRHCVEVADRKGVLVDFEARGTWRELGPDVRRDLTDGPLIALATARSWARLTVVGEPALVSVSVVADCGPIDVPAPATNVQLSEVRHDEVVWVEVRWQLEPSPR
ncbi:hypothetical protein [Tenggerimyces flavus]|uniref:Uncharacterized protein n=1 Tax=Tenggerimyces flavus TaxID=1708749 RepID=A0ABV7Y9Q7_9ACTN|nr:hypothetical protein [Tenggerimyces flavus]MBM7785218.1 hypothetical protein [Tenggerimyces flavus]